MKLSAISTFVGYGISVMMCIVGILVLSGVLVKEGMPVELRMLFGVVLVLYSVYRFMMTRTRAKQAESSDE
ncbi:MAG: hypothetical protein Q8P51_17125 [Ignavibacteria bacterium]|nr:hypothetical protein [Ignavibacteria bacterium]